MRFLSCFAWLIFDPNPTLYFAIAREKICTKIMLPMLKLDTNYGFHELYLYWPVDYVTKYDSFTASLEWSLILIRPVVSWFIRYILYRHLQFLNHVIIIKQRLSYLRHMWPILFRTFACFCFVFCCCCFCCCCFFVVVVLCLFLLFCSQWLSIILCLSVPDEGYSRNASWTLNIYNSNWLLNVKSFIVKNGLWHKYWIKWTYKLCIEHFLPVYTEIGKSDMNK